jgi:hypothetical protein
VQVLGAMSRFYIRAEFAKPVGHGSGGLVGACDNGFVFQHYLCKPAHSDTAGADEVKPSACDDGGFVSIHDFVPVNRFYFRPKGLCACLFHISSLKFSRKSCLESLSQSKIKKKKKAYIRQFGFLPQNLQSKIDEKDFGEEFILQTLI